MSDTNNKAGSFLKGASILAAAGILSRMLGLFYKVPLYALVGSFGNGIYGNVTSIYNTLLMISTVGVPVAVSKMVSEALATKDYRCAKDIFKISTVALCLAGGLSSLFLFFGANWLIEVSEWTPESYLAILAIAAAPFINAICSSFRGYFQGFQNMTPTAVSQIIEQIVRVGLGIFLAWFAIRCGYSVGTAVGGAILGATIGGFFAASFLTIVYVRFMKKNRQMFLSGNENERKTTGQILKRLLWISIPITLTSCIASLFATTDSLIYVPQLAKAGIDQLTATTMFGDYTNVDTLINIPLVISGNIAVAMIPAISESFAIKDRKMVNEKIDIAIRVSVMIALPCCIGLSLLSDGIFDLLFPGSEYGPGLMQMFSYVTLFIMLSSIFQSVLQAIDRMQIPMINLVVGIVIHVVSCYFFLSVPEINIYGIGLANLLTFIYLSASNYLFVKRFTGVKLNLRQTVIKPLIASLIMGGVLWLVFSPVRALLGNIVSLIISFVLAVAVYFIVMIVIGGLDDETIEMLPGQRFLLPVYEKTNAAVDRLFHKVRRK